MSVGPIIIFDKSTLQSLSVDESCWLDNFFLSNITPLFFVETLADLEKKGYSNLTPQQVVGELAKKTPIGAYPNIHYHSLVVHDLLGNKVKMSNRPIIGGGVTKISPEGKVGVHFKQFPETEALQRWQKNEFLKIEHNFARQWRQSLSNLNFELMIGFIKNIVPSAIKFKDLKGIKEFIDQFVTGNDKELLIFAFEVLGIPENARNIILSRWSKEKNPSLNKFAPYATYVLKVDLLFYLGLVSSFISRERPSNKIDLAYLYYLPFCMVFVSNDRLHKRTAPLFMELGQTFINGQDLKLDLGKLDKHYSELPEEVKLQGIMRFATYPPEEINTVIHKLWDKYLPVWRKHSQQKKTKTDFPKDSDKGLVEHLNKIEEESVPVNTKEQITADEADHVIFQRIMPVKKGKWRLVPPEVEEAIKTKK